MKQSDLKEIIGIIKKYDLVSMFSTKKQFDNWIKGLSNKAIKNLKSLNLKPEEITFHTNFLINESLLECDDYLYRLNLLLSVKCRGAWSDNSLVDYYFVRSKHYYYDMQLLTEDMNKYLLEIVGDNVFIDSPYHEEDARLIIDSMKEPARLPDVPSLIVEEKKETKEEKKEKDRRSSIANALKEVATNEDSIKSQYHRPDMRIISKMFPVNITKTEKGCETTDILSEYACDVIALKDDYHIDNMQMLATNPISLIPLYGIMVTPEIIKHKDYRKIVDILFLSKNLLAAVATYYCLQSTISSSYVKRYDNLITQNILEKELSELLLPEHHFFQEGYYKDNTVSTDTDEFLDDIKVLSQSGECALYLGALLSNSNFTKSKYKKEDMNLLLSIHDKKIINDLYLVMKNERSLGSYYHPKDLEIIKTIENDNVRNLLANLAINEDNLKSPYHLYDMEFVSNLSIVDGKYSDEEKEKIINERVNNVREYLLGPDAATDTNHEETLNALIRGEDIQRQNFLDYLDELENNTSLFRKIEKSRVLSKVKNAFRKK